MNRQVLSLLFADLIEYSKIKDDNIIKDLNEYANKFEKHYLNKDNHIYFNTWGDAFFIACLDPMDMLEISLSLRDWYRNLNWRKIHLDTKLSIRIGVHTEKCTIIEKNGIVSDVVGRHVSATARIEPIVVPDSIYCSNLFRDLVVDDSTGFAVFHDIGVHKLAKNFGEMHLFSITRSYETDSNKAPIESPGTTKVEKPFSITIPKIKKSFTEKEINEFEKQVFADLKTYFNKALNQLKVYDNELSSDYEEVSKTKFTCRVYVKGKLKAKCQIWINTSSINRGIHYSQTISDQNHSMNESLRAVSDGFDLKIRPLGMFMLERNQSEKFLSTEESIHYLWNGFIKQLEY